MNVCLDIQPAVAQRAGVGRYTRALVEHLGESRGADRLRLFYFDFRRRGLTFATPGLDQQAIRWCPGRLVQKSWKTLHWPPFDWLAGRADVYHFPNFIIPPLTAGRARSRYAPALRAGRTVVTVHDVSFLRYPAMAEQKNLAYLKARIADTVRRADAVITDSCFSAGEIVELLQADPAKVFSIPLGAVDHVCPPDPEAVAHLRRERGLTRPYLLTVGTLEPRKNTAFLASVFEAMTAFDGDLVIAGMRGWKYEPILERLRASPRAGAIRYLDYVGDNELPALYAGAELFLFPSIYEGFGFPPLEAMLCGAPVIASTAGSLPEVLGEGARLIAEFDAERWAGEALRLLADSAARRKMIAKGRAWAQRYTWRETARQTWAIYRKVAV
ncbi:MAG: glycosyltransferase family 4 protein [Verrucomicrobia bacterium]|nr:glycosyltransferase family 4 protein [Verrucomicrobiota bacterium]